MLLDEGADANKAERNERTPLIVAATLGKEDMVRLLLDSGAYTNLADKDGWSPLHKAVCWGHYNVVKLLLEEGEHPNMKNKEGDTPLFLALKYHRGYLEKPGLGKILSKSILDTR